MKLQELKLNNFQGLRSFSITPNGNSLSVFGENASGKTTIFNAFLWLLFDKNSANKKDFDIKPLDDTGEAQHGLESSVEGVFDLDGQELTLKKVYKEQWTKKRGSATDTFTGHTTDYYIDGVPVPLKDYKAQVESIRDEDSFKLLTNPLYFNEMLSWQKRREVLLSLCGDVDDSDVIASNAALKDLPEILANKTFEQRKAILTARRSEINKAIQQIPTRIDEISGTLNDLGDFNADDAKVEIETISDEILKKTANIASIKGGGAMAAHTKKLNELQSELLKLEGQHQNESNKANDAVYKSLSDLKTKLANVVSLRDSLPHRVDVIGAQIIDIANNLDNLRAEYKTVQAEQLPLPHDSESVCPTCGQPIPEERLAEARTKAIESLNRDKSIRLTKINEKGKKLKDEKEALETLQSQTKEELDKARAEADRLLTEIRELEASIGEQPVADDSTYQKNRDRITTEIGKVQSVVEGLQSDNKELIDEVQGEVDELNGRRILLERKLALAQANSKVDERIAELKEQERKLAAEYEATEREMFLIDEFTRTKVSLLESLINNRFEVAKFKLFKEQINGGIEETCETMVSNGSSLVPYSSLNSAARIQVGIDIIKTLSAFYGFDAPIFIDNRESVTELPKTDAQVISLYVSEGDKVLRIEQVATGKPAAKAKAKATPKTTAPKVEADPFINENLTSREQTHPSSEIPDCLF